VGIPAHPATADAALETGDADWTFDTWTEFLVPTSSGTEWLVLHPHEYPTMNPMRRNNFGGQPVATESFNDIIVFADTNWNWSETGDQATDASYKRNPCSEPEEHISKKNWVYEICEEYWAPKTHWGCGTTSSAAAVGAISLNLGDFALGRTFSGIFTLDNRDPQALTGELAMELAFDLPESKQFPDSIVHTDTSALDVPSRGRVERSFRFDVPKTAPVGMDFVVRARMGDRVFAVQWLQPENLIDVGVEFSEPTRVGVTRRIDVVVRNRSKRVLTDVFVTARAPLTVFLSKESPIRISALQPSEEDTLHIDARFLAPEESGAIVVDVGSADGGWARATRLFTVPDERLNVTPVPIVPEPR
jgi:hypothetical protein